MFSENLHRRTPRPTNTRAAAATAIGAALGSVLALTPLSASAEIVGESVIYEVDGETFEGYLSRNTALGDDRPTVVIVHDWDGLTEYEMRRADMLAAQGYAAFAIDVYGQDVRPQSTEESQEASGAMYGDRDTFRARLMGGLEALGDIDGVDDDDVVVIGYCFGGAGVLEMARAGADDVEGYVVFHGGLGTPEGQDYGGLDEPMLLLHGSADPVSSMADLAVLTEELDGAGVDHRAMIFGGVGHAFTVWSSGDYDLEADRASWQAMLDFLDETLD
ncbi:dienelactone hydrolase family protein [Fodinicurvata sp. EGI_FJ10296]|uniref:dienelactone hydrolase family protein n=1 Tax=Fodinicurvata sp. EGI_FJ10296 TaxID=3231908 RepID=UPI0034528B2F